MGSSSLNLERLLAGSMKELTWLAHQLAVSRHLCLPKLGPGPAPSPLVCSLSLLLELPEWRGGLLPLWFPCPPLSSQPALVLVSALSRA